MGTIPVRPMLPNRLVSQRASDHRNLAGMERFVADAKMQRLQLRLCERVTKRRRFIKCFQRTLPQFRDDVSMNEIEHRPQFRRCCVVAGTRSRSGASLELISEVVGNPIDVLYPPANNLTDRQSKFGDGNVTDQPSDVVCSLEWLEEPIFVVEILQKRESVAPRCLDLINGKFERCHAVL